MATRTPVAWTRVLAAGALIVVVGTVVNVVLALLLTSWLRVPAVFTPLKTPNVASFTVAGLAGAVAVFVLLARSRPDPVRAFRLVAPAVLVISWVPDLLVWATRAFPGTTGPGVLSLMCLHAAAAALAVLLLGVARLAGPTGRP